ncbi:conserved hypothetical protein [Ricinus communis]|uniref:Uncharacterized protein n=1 Tax=Ricinus communis TaxID=3988 RepID=B9TM34_RICCO|nr:conserved hypothetical protein [Ricinus communis]
MLLDPKQRVSEIECGSYNAIPSVPDSQDGIWFTFLINQAKLQRPIVRSEGGKAPTSLSIFDRLAAGKTKIPFHFLLSALLSLRELPIYSWKPIAASYN